MRYFRRASPGRDARQQKVPELSDEVRARSLCRMPENTLREWMSQPILSCLICRRKLIEKRRVEMVDAAKNMNFIEAAQMRDEIIAMEDRLSKMPAE